MSLELGAADCWFRGHLDFVKNVDEKCTFSSASSIGENSSDSDSDGDGASSSSPTDTISDGPFSDFSDIMKHLPIKRGLSKCYDGKSDSFVSLSRALSVEDLAKKVVPCRRKRFKSSKKYPNGFSAESLHKVIVTKKVTGISSCFPAKKRQFARSECGTGAVSHMHQSLGF